MRERSQPRQRRLRRFVARLRFADAPGWEVRAKSLLSRARRYPPEKKSPISLRLYPEVRDAVNSGVSCDYRSTTCTHPLCGLKSSSEGLLTDPTPEVEDSQRELLNLPLKR